jgi:hypothetical protein
MPSLAAPIVPLMNTALPTRITSRRVASSLIFPSRTCRRWRAHPSLISKSHFQIGSGSAQALEPLLLNAVYYVVVESRTNLLRRRATSDGLQRIAVV